MPAAIIDIRDAMARAQGHAPYLARQMEIYSPLADEIAAGDIDAAWAHARALRDQDAPIAARLRRCRNACWMVAAIADLSGHWDMSTTTRHLSDVADDLVGDALMHAFAERYPDAGPVPLVVIALGKHGSRELNYSSDIDPILLCDPARFPHGSREEPVEAAVRVAQRMITLLNHRDADGFVFRVDLRLRPSPDVTPIVLPAEAAISYYESMALSWEQAAFIRARVAAGDQPLGEMFLQEIRPFIWRRSLDFGALKAISSITARIRDHYAQGQILAPGYDLKRGRGGIREVEFFAQVQQLIHGGRWPELREPATRDALAALAGAGIVDRDVATRMDDAYVLLRTVEHRLQMVEDRQTHRLPESAHALDNVAALHGVADGDALIALLRPIVEHVGSVFDGLLPAADTSAGSGLPMERDALDMALREAGFADPATAITRIEEWRGGSIRALRGDDARAALEEVMIAIMPAIARAPDPQAALNRLDRLIRALPTAINFFRLLAARPQLVEALATILSLAPVLAEALGQRASLLDGLIDASAFNLPPDVAALCERMSARVDARDYQSLLDQVRQQVGDRRFALGCQIVTGRQDPLDVAAGYARVAEAAVETLTTATIAEFEEAHGRVPGSELVILAMGRFGGGMLTHASDLDLVYLFTGEFEAESDGPKPLGGTHYFNRLAQRVSNALSVATASGALYEVDTRLRPSGAKGLLAVNLDSFERYQRDDAWTWEHLALTRARPVFGSAAARVDVLERIGRVLAQPRDFARLRRDAVKMRRDIAAAKPPQGPIDVKLLPGGLVDLEFLVHVTQFSHGSGFHPRLDRAIDALVAGRALAPSLRAAHDLLTRYLVVSRLVTPSSDMPPVQVQPMLASACGVDSWAALVDTMAEARALISGEWQDIVTAADADGSMDNKENEP